jgi:Rod binding domain-containing protein
MEASSGLQLPGTTFQPLVDLAKFNTNESELQQSSEDFEAIFLRLVLTEMMPKDGAFFGEGTDASTYQSMFVNAIADELGSRGALGIGESLRSEISQRGILEDPEIPVKENQTPVIGSVLYLAG